jgi:hypothetical protein
MTSAGDNILHMCLLVCYLQEFISCRSYNVAA